MVAWLKGGHLAAALSSEVISSLLLSTAVQLTDSLLSSVEAAQCLQQAVPSQTQDLLQCSPCHLCAKV